MQDLIIWFYKLQAPQAGLVGAIFAACVTLLSGLIRDFIATWWNELRSENKKSREIFRHYAEPLALTTSSLFWRLKEITTGGPRAAYLLAEEPRTEFDEYKFKGTTYRVAATLGCIRALRRELSFYQNGRRHKFRSLEVAIDDFESALADGHHVEIMRLRGLMKLWEMNSILDEASEKIVATAIELCIDRKLGTSNMQKALQLTEIKQIDLCKAIALKISEHTKQPEPSLEALRSVLSESIKQIAIREAWIFRDWQTAIGDQMIREAKFGDRKFEIIGFGEFEKLHATHSTEFARLYKRISALLAGIDIDKEDEFDARPKTVRVLFRKTSNLMLALAKSPAGNALFEKSTLAAAREATSNLDL